MPLAPARGPQGVEELRLSHVTERAIPNEATELQLPNVSHCIGVSDKTKPSQHTSLCLLGFARCVPQ